MALADRPLNLQAIAIEETETKIRETVKREYLNGTPKEQIDKKVFALISAVLKRIHIPNLQDLTKRSLLKFYSAQYQELKRSLGVNLALYAAILLLAGKTPTGEKITPTRAQTEQAKKQLLTSPYIDEGLKSDIANQGNSRILGNAMNTYAETYAKQHVKPVIDRLSKQFPEDPDDVSIKHRNSLRNLAEMEVRWQGHVDEVEKLKADGVKLAIVSTHADCSERCSGAQGKVVSLDGSTGVTDDGRPYKPLEEYTDVYVTTAAGKTYKNGLFGFNCRHYLVPYQSGYRFPKPNVAQERKQYAITERQRQLESNVRRWRTEAIESKGLDPKRYKVAKAKAEKWNKLYIDFSRKNNRAYYPSRTKIL